MKLFHPLILYILSGIFFAGCKDKPQGTLIMVPAEPSGKFNFPYYLFIPDDTSRDTIIPLIIEPNNSGFASDNFDEHLEKAKRTASQDYYVGNYLAQMMKTPLLVPVFPRPK